MSTTDAQVQRLMARIEEEKKAIKEIESPRFKTKMTYAPQRDSMNNAINLHVEKSVETLVQILGEILANEAAYDIANGVLKAEAAKFTWHGYTSDEWQHDISLRIEKLRIQTRKERLDKLEKSLESLVSPELRTQMELARIMAELGETA